MGMGVSILRRKEGVEYGADNGSYSEMGDRLQDLYLNNSFMSAQRKELLADPSFTVNVNAMTVILKPLNEIYNKVLTYGENLISGRTRNNIASL